MKTKKTLVLLLIITAIIAGLMFTQNKINYLKNKHNLVEVTVIEDAPPSLTFISVAFGSFRGIIADILWIRAISLQEQKHYFEFAQVADWIAKLQPKFTGVNMFLAWNMAYNISVAYTDPKKKWKWVESGINILKKAIKSNPSSALLYRDLAWIYINKIGDRFDSANLYYKYILAKNMNDLIGPNPNWQELSKAPKTRDELFSLIPKNDFFWTELFLNINFKDISEIENNFKKNYTLNLPTGFVSNNQLKIKILLNYLKVHTLKTLYNMEPKKILAINKKFGELDWRLWQAHAIYWCYEGLNNTIENEECDDVLDIALKSVASDGYLLYIPKKDYNLFVTIPRFHNLDLIESYYNSRLNKKKIFTPMGLYQNFLQTAILNMYIYSMNDSAEKYYKKLQNTNMYNKITYQQFIPLYFRETILRLYDTAFLSYINKMITTECLLEHENMQHDAANITSFIDIIFRTYSNMHPNVINTSLEKLYLDKKTQIENNEQD